MRQMTIEDTPKKKGKLYMTKKVYWWTTILDNLQIPETWLGNLRRFKEKNPRKQRWNLKKDDFLKKYLVACVIFI